MLHLLCRTKLKDHDVFMSNMGLLCFKLLVVAVDNILLFCSDFKEATLANEEVFS